MPQITIEMTTAELLALDIIAFNKQEWVDNFVTDRARRAKEDLKATPEWAKAFAEFVKEGGNYEDEWAVLEYGVKQGIIKTAAQRQAEMEEAMAAEQAAREAEAAVTEETDAT